MLIYVIYDAAFCMTEPKTNYFNLGLYSISEAARLTRVSPSRVRRWLRGYTFKSKGKAYVSPPVWTGQLEAMAGGLTLTFFDLIEVRIVYAFLKEGVSWKTLRTARGRAQELFQQSHPFCSNRFGTDGREIFIQLSQETSEPKLLELTAKQQVFAGIVQPFLKELEFSDENGLVRWWPLGHNRAVVLDPKRCFGQPIVAQEGVPTIALAQAVRTTGSLKEAASWYEVPEASVQDAIKFEEGLAL